MNITKNRLRELLDEYFDNANAMEDILPRPIADYIEKEANRTHNIKGQIKEVLFYFNDKSDKNFSTKHTSANAEIVAARLKEGHSVGECKTVIDNKAADWKDDDDMNTYLRPSTLFARCHFEEYLNQKPANSGRTRKAHI